MKARGINCEVELFDHHIVIKRTGLFAAGSRLGGDKSVPLSSITSVQFRRAGMFSPGFIKFGILGEADPGWDKLIHPNVVGFRSSQQVAFQRICDAIQSSINLPSLAVLASQHARERSDRAIPSSSAEGDGSRHEHVLIDASSSRLPGAAADQDVDATLSHEPDWSAWGRHLRFLLKMTGYSIALSLFVGATGLGQRLEGFDLIELPGVSFRFISLVLFIALVVALVSPIARIIPLANGPRLAHWIRRAPRISVTTIIFAIPIILVTGGPSPYPQEAAPDREIVIEHTGQPDAQTAELPTRKTSTAAVVAPANDWSGRYDGTFDGATGRIDIVRTDEGRLSISIGMEGERCAGSVDAVVSPPEGNTIIIAKAPHEDGAYQESACRLSLRKQGEDIDQGRRSMYESSRYELWI
ncbi:hypothetical protein ACFSTI_06600 [Rhizorhabdus histidinilytica]